MPAVELLHLRTQIRELSNRFDDPPFFCSGLKEILEQYANRTYRAGQVVQTQPLFPSYRVAPLILRELEIELRRFGQAKPEQALRAADILWNDAYLETRYLASVLLGSVPIEQADHVVRELHRWAKPDENYRMIDTLFQNGTTILRRQGSSLLLSLAEEWIESTSVQDQALGIHILVPLVLEDTYENLPPIYRMLSSLVQKMPGKLQADLQTVIEALIKRSPVETAYFLRQALPIAQGQATARLIRRCLPAFPTAQQEILKAAIRTTNLS